MAARRNPLLFIRRLVQCPSDSLQELGGTKQLVQKTRRAPLNHAPLDLFILVSGHKNDW